MMRGKGLSETLEIFNQVRLPHPEFNLHIVGDGPERILIPAERDRDKIHYYGSLSHQETMNVIKNL